MATYDVLLTKSDKTPRAGQFDMGLNLTGVEARPPKGAFGLKPGGPRPGVGGGAGEFRGPGGPGPGRPWDGPQAPTQG